MRRWRWVYDGLDKDRESIATARIGSEGWNGGSMNGRLERI